MQVGKTDEPMSSVTEQATLPLIEDVPEPQSGIYPSQAIKAAIARGDIKAGERINPLQIQPASLDLRLGSTAYHVPASFLPGSAMRVEDKLVSLSAEKFSIADGAVLETSKVYLIQLMEHLSLRKRLSALANPKSSTGRLDVFTRVITDFGTEFDTIREGYKGPLWLEVAPRSFNVKVRAGSRLSQVRLKTGSPPSSDAYVRKLHEQTQIVHTDSADIKDGAIALSVDIAGDQSGGLIGYKAKRTDAFIDVDLVGHYEPDDFWENVYRPESGGIILEPDDFHILATKETVAIPADVAADMVAYDTLVGEFRVHYAGFFDPGFGYAGDRPIGARVVLEVRSHEVPFLIEDGQMVGRVLVERLTAPTKKPYGADIGSNYQRQGLALSKQFKKSA